MARFRSVMLAAVFGFAGALMGTFFHWPPAALLRAQVAGLSADKEDDDRQQAAALLDRDAKLLEQSGQLVSQIKRTVKLASPFVVHIEAKKREEPRNGRVRTVEEAGAGIIVQRKANYYVVTNRHVIKDAARESVSIQVEDGRAFQPTHIDTDPDTDLAVMSITAENLVPARIGDSRQVEIGEFVLALGSPFGLSHSISLGIISAKGRRDLKLGGDSLKYQDFLQTDAAINPGNSGGPLVNLRGEVIALNTAIASASGTNEGIGFGIPVNMVMFVARQLIDNGTVRRAKMGVSLDRDFTADLARTAGLTRMQGARVTSVEPGSPAETAGILAGDIVLEFDGVTVESDVHLVNLVSMTPIGQMVPVTVVRDRKRTRVNCTLVERPALSLRLNRQPDGDDTQPEAQPRSWELAQLGAQVADLTPQLAQELNLTRNLKGLLLTSVDPNGPLAGHVHRGDVIDRIEQQSVRSVQEAQRLLRQFGSADEIRLHVIPGSVGNSPRTVIIRPESVYR